MRMVPGKFRSPLDGAPWLGDQETWTTLQNVRWKGPGTFGEVRGTTKALDVWADVSELLAVEQRWVLGTSSDIRVWDGVSLTSKARPGGYGAGAWVGEVFGGVPLMTNGVDPPQYQVGYGNFDNLPAWPTGLRARFIKGFRNFLLVFGLSLSGTPLPHTVRWSHPAAPGEVPLSWDIGDPTKDAGEVSLPDDESGEIVEALALGPDLLVYKKRSVWRMRFIGPPFIFDTQRVLGGVGARDRGCVAPIKGGTAHLIFTEESDLVVYDGTEVVSVAAGSFRGLLKSLGVPKLFSRPQKSEVWLFFPNVTGVWSWETGLFSLVTIGGVTAAARGRSPVPVQTWDSVTVPWDQMGEELWDAGYEEGETFELVAMGQRLERLEGGAALPGLVERRFIPVGERIASRGVRFLLRRVDPLAQPDPVIFVAADREWGGGEPMHEVEWLPWCPLSGDSFSLRLVFNGPFTFGGIDYDIIPVGVNPTTRAL